MSQEATAPKLFGCLVRAQGGALVALALYGVWLLAVLFNDMFFMDAASVLDAIAAYGWGLGCGVATSGLLAIAMSRACRSLSGRGLVIAAFSCALGVCAVLAARMGSLVDPILGAALMVLASSASILVAILAVVGFLGSLPLEMRFGALILCLAGALVAFCCVLAAPSRSVRLAVLACSLALGLAVAAKCWPRGSIGDVLVGARFGARPRTAFTLLFVGCGFLCSYELNTMQKTTHLTSEVVGQTVLGGTTVASLLAQALLVFLLCLVLRELRRPRLAVAAIVFALVLLGIYYCLPIMANQTFPISFVLILALGFTFLLSTTLLFLEGRRADGRAGDGSGARRFSVPMALVLTGLGALAGVALAYVLMDYLASVSLVSQMLSFLPALVIFAVLGCLLFFGRDIMVLAKPELQADQSALQELDTSSMDGRCRLFAQRFKLTKREGEVLRLVSQGRNIPGIAESLVVSQATAKTHLLHIYKKAGVSSRQELIDLLYGDAGEEANGGH